MELLLPTHPPIEARVLWVNGSSALSSEAAEIVNSNGDLILNNDWTFLPIAP